MATDGTIAAPAAAPSGTIAAPATKAADPAPAKAADPAPVVTSGDPVATKTSDPAPVAPAASAKPGETPSAVTATAWPAEGLPPDYRARMLKGLEGDDLRAATNLLERLGSPADVVKKLLNQERQLSQPRKAVRPGKDAKPEEIAAWRKENDVPESPDKYDVKLPDGMVLGDADKEVFKEFAPAMHDAGLSNQQVSAVMAQYLAMAETENNNLIKKDSEFQAKADKSLRDKWGPDYDRNINAIGVILQDAPEGLGEALLNGRLADGRKIGDTPEFVEFLSALAMQAVPTATLLPSDMPNGPTLASEITNIEAIMKKDINAYFKDTAMQKRYADLLAARDVQTAKTRRA